MVTIPISEAMLRRIDRRAARSVREATTATLPRVDVSALVHDLDSDVYALELRFAKLDGDVGTITFPRSLTAAPHEIVRQLLDAGALLPNDRKTATELVQASLTTEASDTRETTRRGGWHGPSFVTPSRTYGPASGRLHFVGTPAADPGIGLRSGSFEEWREGIREPCDASSFLTFGLGIGFAGPLLDPLGEDEGAVFNFFGYSSGGKTLVARCLHSQAGRARSSDLATYGITLRGAEELCFARNDGAVVFDEESRAKGSVKERREHIRTLAFMVPSGRGTIRSERVGRKHDLPNLTWRVFGLSSGEKPLEEPGARRVAGEQVRHVDIKIPDTSRGGIFDLIEGENDERGREGARLAGLVEATLAAHYGLARGRFLRRLTAERSSLGPELNRIVEEFIAAVGADTQAWERRLARKFGIVMVGAVLAARWEVAPFTPEHAHRCVHNVYRAARRSIFSIQEQTDDLVRELRLAVAAGRFPALAKGEALSANLTDFAWGFRREQDGRLIVAVLPDRFEALAPSKPSADAILDVLVEKGAALPGLDGKRHRQVAALGFPRAGRGRWVCLLASKL